MKNTLTLFLAFICCAATIGTVFAEEEAAAEKTAAPVFPLSVGEDWHLQAGTLYDLDVTRLPFKIVNTSGQAVKYLGMRMNCNCMTVAKDEPGRVLQAGESIDAAVDVDPAKLPNVKKLNRIFYIEAEGFEDPQRVVVLGTIVDSAVVEPAEVMDLAEFAGVDIPWKRTFTIANNNPNIADADFVLEPPAQPGRQFETELKQTAPGKYTLTVSPKLPMKNGKFHEVIGMHIAGRPIDAKVRVGITGTVQGYALRSIDSRAFAQRSILREGRNCVLEFPLQFQHRLPRRQSPYKWSMKTRRLPAAVEELAAINADPQGFIEKLRQNITFSLPEYVKAELLSGDNSMTLKLTFLPEFLGVDNFSPVELLVNGSKVCSFDSGIAIRPERSRKELPASVPFVLKAEVGEEGAPQPSASPSPRRTPRFRRR